MTLEERAERIYRVCQEAQATVGSPRPIPSVEWFAAEIRAAEEAMLERCVRRVRETYRPYQSEEQTQRVLREIEAAMREET